LLFAAPARAEIYRWTDETGRTHFDDDVARVPADQRDDARVFQTKPRVEASPAGVSNVATQAAFAAGLARELGLQTASAQDPVSLLHIVGIYPSMGWYPATPLSPGVVQEVVTSTRAAARARRLAQPETSAEAAALRVASALGVATPPPAAVEPPSSPPPAIVVAPNIVIEAPPVVVVERVERPPPVVLSNYPTFAFGIPFAPAPVVPIGPVPERITPLSNPAGRLHGPLITPLRPGKFSRPIGF
jgi:hypothetical protein